MQKCHFCGKNQKQVFKLLEGIDGVHICDPRVDLRHFTYKRRPKATSRRCKENTYCPSVLKLIRM